MPQMLRTGERAITVKGRMTSGFPRVNLDSKQGLTKTLKAVDVWLVENAIKQAAETGDDFNGTYFATLVGRKLSPCDRDCLNEYLFGEV